MYTSCDSLVCYDRVACSVISLALKHIGIPKHGIGSICGTLHHMVHIIRMVFSDSSSSYGDDDCDPSGAIKRGLSGERVVVDKCTDPEELGCVLGNVGSMEQFGTQ